MQFPLSDVANQVLNARYIHKELGENSWEDVVSRVVNYVWPDAPAKVFELLLERYFVPNSPMLVNAGTKISGLAACYTVPFGDSIEEIIQTKYQFMKICQKGGGCGTTLSHIRPEGMPVAGSTHSKAAGPIKFFNTICEDMKVMSQAGFRDMAILGAMSCKHPDIEKFILAKTDEGAMNNANISVLASDEFMKAALAGIDWETRFNSFVRKFNAGELLDLITKQAWSNGEPGMLFEDTINRNTPYKYSNQYLDKVNPCSEQPLPNYGVCVLASIDLSKFVEDGKVDLIALALVAELVVEFLDRAIDKSEWPTKEIAEWVGNNRAIGIGVMGFADLLLKLGIAYGSEESVKIAESLGTVLYVAAKGKSEELGKERGIPTNCAMLPTPRRNITLLSIAPTGSISLISGCSAGIEPIYAPITLRKDNTGSYEFCHEEADKPYFRSAINSDNSKVVSWKEHVDVQAAWQKHVDSGVSKTINMPEEATQEDVKNAFVYAWRSGCKGITIYRNNSRKVQVLSQKITSKEKEPVTRPTILGSKTVKLKDGGDGSVYITVSFMEDHPFEVFVNSPSMLLHDVQIRDSISRLSSLALRYGVPIDKLIKELKQIPAQTLKSVPLQLATVLELLYDKKQTCPKCGGELQYKEGCYTCSCAYSKCS